MNDWFGTLCLRRGVTPDPKLSLYATGGLDSPSRVRKSARRSALLFVHGFNVTFEDAARRTAQMAYDLAFEGAPVFYRWPSQRTSPAYMFDEQNIEWAQADLKGFLEDFFTHSDAESIYLIAHSMGNRALTRAVASLLTERPALRNRLKEVILAARIWMLTYSNETSLQRSLQQVDQLPCMHRLETWL